MTSDHLVGALGGRIVALGKANPFSNIEGKSDMYCAYALAIEDAFFAATEVLLRDAAQTSAEVERVEEVLAGMDRGRVIRKVLNLSARVV